MEILKKLLNKIINIQVVFPENDLNYNNLKLINFDEDFVILESYDKEKIYLNKQLIFSMYEADEKDTKKFNEYRKKYLKDKNFKGDVQIKEKESNYLG